MQPAEDGNGQHHEQHIGHDVDDGVEVQVRLRIDAPRAELRTVVPPAAHRRAPEQPHQRHDRRGHDDGADRRDADPPERGVRREAQVEDDHGDFRERVGDAAECHVDVGVLWGRVSVRCARRSGGEDFAVLGPPFELDVGEVHSEAVSHHYAAEMDVSTESNRSGEERRGGRRTDVGQHNQGQSNELRGTPGCQHGMEEKRITGVSNEPSTAR